MLLKSSLRCLRLSPGPIDKLRIQLVEINGFRQLTENEGRIFRGSRPA